jgi:hypothetical protein
MADPVKDLGNVQLPTKDLDDIHIWTASHVSKPEQLTLLADAINSCSHFAKIHFVALSYNEEFNDTIMDSINDIITTHNHVIFMVTSEQTYQFFHFGHIATYYSSLTVPDRPKYTLLSNENLQLSRTNDTRIMLVDDDDLFTGDRDTFPNFSDNGSIRGMQFIPIYNSEDNEGWTYEQAVENLAMDKTIYNKDDFNRLFNMNVDHSVAVFKNVDVVMAVSTDLSGYGCKLVDFFKYLASDDFQRTISVPSLWHIIDTTFMNWVDRELSPMNETPFIFHRIWRTQEEKDWKM